MDDLSRCDSAPCRGATPSLPEAGRNALRARLRPSWEVIEGSWPWLTARVFAVRVLRCGQRRSRLKWTAAITKTNVITGTLAHLNLEYTVSLLMAARPPSQPDLAY